VIREIYDIFSNNTIIQNGAHVTFFIHGEDM